MQQVIMRTQNMIKFSVVVDLFKVYKFWHINMNIPQHTSTEWQTYTLKVEQWIVKKKQKKTLHSKQYITSFFCNMINSLQKKSDAASS